MAPFSVGPDQELHAAPPPQKKNKKSKDKTFEIQLNQGLEAFNVHLRKEDRLKINDLILPKIISN